MAEKIDDAILQDKVRLKVNQFIFNNGFAPNTSQLSEMLTFPVVEIERGLSLLATNHAIVLHPNSYDIWVAHPFALFPTLFWVKSNNKQFWSNCIWCSFGIATLCQQEGKDCDILTRLNGEEDNLLLQIRKNELIQKNYVVHLPIPVKHLWDNVIYTCSMQIVFENEQGVNDWCGRHNKQKGEVVPIEIIWDLAKIWYGNYMDEGFKRKTKETAEEMFASVGLTSEFFKF
jgi:hypothetical protein